MTNDFTVVSDELRVTGIGRGQIGPAVQALMDGKTILVEHYRPGRYTTTLGHHGFRLHQHKTEQGMVLWAEKIEPESGD